MSTRRDEASQRHGPTHSSNKRHRDLAVYHANLIQQQAQIESRILDATETLMDYPPADDADPLHPTESDARQVKTLLQPFQPADYDALIQERNINGRCGYVLCPRPHRSEQTNAKFRIVKDSSGGRGAFKVVNRLDLEKWCSDVCGKHALYIRVQMLETPAWERRAQDGMNLDLYSEDVRHHDNPEVRKLLQDFDQLALERGEKATGSFRSESVPVGIVENKITETPVAPSNAKDHTAIEGYTPGRAASLAANLRQLTLDGDSEDIMDSI